MLSMWMSNWLLLKKFSREYACAKWLGRMSIGNSSQQARNVVWSLVWTIAKVILRLNSYYGEIPVWDVGMV